MNTTTRKPSQPSHPNRAVWTVASTYSILVGLAGIDHGIFEILQGNRVPESLMIEAIGPEQRFWQYGVETALTIVPNFLLTGILAVIVGLIVLVWGGFFVQRKHGAGVLMLLSLVLFLVGGGFAPIFMAVLGSLAATRINKPLTWWRGKIPAALRSALAFFWPFILIAFVLVFVVSVEIAIFGWPLTTFFDDQSTMDYLNNLSYLMVGLMVLSVLSSLAHDARKMVSTRSA